MTSVDDAQVIMFRLLGKDDAATEGEVVRTVPGKLGQHFSMRKVAIATHGDNCKLLKLDEKKVTSRKTQVTPTVVIKVACERKYIEDDCFESIIIYCNLLEIQLSHCKLLQLIENKITCSTFIFN